MIARLRAWLPGLVLPGLLAGCGSPGGPVLHPPGAAPAQPPVELTDTPFFPQEKYQCGPAALATVLGASGRNVTAEALVGEVYLPGRGGSLQVEMMAAARRYGRVPYPLEVPAENDPAPLELLLAEVDAGRPVLVLQNLGIAFLDRWHYAVLVGYDRAADEVVLRSGTERREVLAARRFLRTFERGGRWAVVLLRPGELPAAPQPRPYLRAAAAFERGGTPEQRAAAFAAATEQWPGQALAWIGLGAAHYDAGLLSEAAAAFRQAIAQDPAQAVARNNLAQVMLDAGCPERARALVGQALKLHTSDDPLRAAMLKTRAAADAAGATSGECRLR